MAFLAPKALSCSERTLALKGPFLLRKVFLSSKVPFCLQTSSLGPSCSFWPQWKTFDFKKAFFDSKRGPFDFEKTFFAPTGPSLASNGPVFLSEKELVCLRSKMGPFRLQKGPFNSKWLLFGFKRSFSSPKGRLFAWKVPLGFK